MDLGAVAGDAQRLSRDPECLTLRRMYRTARRTISCMPAIASLEALERAIAEFEVNGLDVTIEQAAVAAARRSVEESGLLWPPTGLPTGC